MTSLDGLRLSIQTARRLAAAGIETVPELCAQTAEELRARPGFGPVRLSEVRRALAGHELRLRGDEAPAAADALPPLAVDVLAAIRERIAELGLTRAEVADRCQALRPLAAGHRGPGSGWRSQLARHLGPEHAPRDGNPDRRTLEVILAALDLEIRPREQKRQSP